MDWEVILCIFSRWKHAVRWSGTAEVLNQIKEKELGETAGRRLTDDGSGGRLSSFSLTDRILIYFYLSLNLYFSYHTILHGPMTYFVLWKETITEAELHHWRSKWWNMAKRISSAEKAEGTGSRARILWVANLLAGYWKLLSVSLLVKRHWSHSRTWILGQRQPSS